MKSVTSSKLQNNLDQLLDEILNTGKPLEIERNGKRLRIIPVINEHELYISPMVRLELQYLYEIGRITEKSDDILLDLVNRLDLKICQTDFNLIMNQSVIINWTRDPFDRLIVSNASVDNHILLTKDCHILKHYENAVWD